MWSLTVLEYSYSCIVLTHSLTAEVPHLEHQSQVSGQCTQGCYSFHCVGQSQVILVAWCSNAVGNSVRRYCSLLLEVTILKCRRFNLLREFTAIVLVAVYITCNSKNKRSKALSKLSNSSVNSRQPI